MATVAASMPAAGSPVRDVVDLRTEPSWAVTGAGSIAPVGDVSGDGAPDAAVSNCGADGNAGRVEVVWGPFEAGAAAFEDPGPGFSILGPEADAYACRLSMVAAGDVNGDDLDDLLVGAYLADQNDRSASGAVYVVFGKADEDPVELAAFDAGTQGARGYRVDGPAPGALAGIQLAGLGDMNGDDLADFVVGSPFHGSSYVVFGQSTTDPVDLMAFDRGTQGDRGFRIDTYTAEISHGFSLGAADDVNGDAVPDVVVGLIRDIHGTPGSAYVVFGKADGLPVDTTRHTSGSFRIKGSIRGEGTGSAVSAAGDVNGDGLGDVVVGAPKTYSCCRGKVAVVFGKTDTRTVRLDELGSGGFKVKASQRTDFFGYEVAGIGDVDGDGLDDVAVGAPGHDYPERGGPGAVFVIYGKKSSSRLRAGRLGTAGFAIVGRDSVDWTGTYLGAPGDMNGDGTPDLMISATSGSKSYLLWLRSGR